MSITALPTPPSRSDPTNFASRGDAFLGALPTFATECNATAAAINASQIAANNSAIAAAASASSAASATGVVAWVSGATYNSGDNVYSLINFLTYRRKTAGAGTTDPSADNTNWQLLTGQGDVTSAGANTLTNNLSFSGTGLRLRGDFSNNTLSSRLSFQSNTTNGLTYLQVLPNGAGNNSGFSCYGNSDPTNTNFGDISNNSTEVRLRSGITGTGTYLPLTVYTGGIERIRILTNGKIGMNTSTPSTSLHVTDSTNSIIRSEGQSGYGAFSAWSSGSSSSYVFFGNSSSGEIARIQGSNNNSLTVATGSSAKDRLIIDGLNALIIAPNCNGIGYSSGSGGTAFQSGNKSGTVGLNKPSGQITMMNTSLASNSSINFILNNTCINSTDVVIVNIVGGVADIRNYQTWAGFNSSGSVQIILRNISGGSLSEAVVLNFVIIKGSST